MNTSRLAAQAPDAAADDDAITRRALARVGLVLRGKWRIDRLLGVGGMAAVYASRHRNGKRGAIKMLHHELSMHAEARTRFLREGYMANHVDHPGAVSVLDDDVTEDGSVFLVMELLEGQSVAALAESRPNGRLGLGETLRIAEQLLDVLVAAHAKGIVHRDLKPENLFLTKEGALKVLDFGLARLLEMPGAAKLTKTATAMGTPAFMPPEQALGEWSRVDARSDLWAVGASIFSLLTGRFVHEAPTLNQLLLKSMTVPAPAIRSLLPGLPADAAEVVDRALAFDPKDRWPGAGAMQRAVRDALASLAVRGEPQLGAVAAAPAELGSAGTQLGAVATAPAELGSAGTQLGAVATAPTELGSAGTQLGAVATAPTELGSARTQLGAVAAASAELGSARTVQLAAQATRGGPPMGALIGGALLVFALAGTGLVLVRTTRSASPPPPATDTAAEDLSPAAAVTTEETPEPPAQPAPTISPAAEPTVEARPSAAPTVEARPRAEPTVEVRPPAEPTTAATASASASTLARPAPASTGASPPSTPATKKIDPSFKEWK